MNIRLSPMAVEYTVCHLMHVAAPQLKYELLPCDGSLEFVMLRAGKTTIRFACIPQTEWAALTAGTFPMRRIPSFDGGVSVPLLLGEGKDFAEISGNTLTVHADLITLSFLLLSRAEEVLLSQRDSYGRFQYAFSLAKKYGFVDIPIVDEWAMLLRQWLLRLFPAEALGNNTPSLRPTHDMDTARRFSSASVAAKSILGGDLLLRKSPKIAWESLCQYLASRNRPELDPELLGAKKLLELSLRYGFCSEFYWMGLENGEPDFRYDVAAPAVSAFAEKVKRSGMVCGFHGSRLTFQDGSRFSVEQGRVAASLGHAPVCGRQHYLCFDAEQTPLIQEATGMRRDSTLGFADREGFRCGTCHAYPLYDLKNDRPLTVTEFPLIVMDGSMRGRGLTKAEALDSLRGLFDRCYAVGGEFVILWHNRSAVREWTDWFQQVYVPFMDWAAKRLGKEKVQ